MASRNIKPTLRNDRYADKYQTRIIKETAEGDNPFIATEVQCSGYDLHELANNVSYVEMLFLMIKGDLPSAGQKQFLNKLFVYFSHPGPRHEASRAAVLAGVGKTIPENVLPASMLVYGGSRTGAGNVEACMRFINKNRRKPVEETVVKVGSEQGFCSYYGGIDEYAKTICKSLIASDIETDSLQWVMDMDELLADQGKGIGMTRPMIAAAAFCDLGILPRYGVALLQHIASAGLLAQAFENANRPATVLPFVSDDNYFIDEGYKEDDSYSERRLEEGEPV